MMQSLKMQQTAASLIFIWTMFNYCLCWYSWGPNEELILHLLLHANICILTKSSDSGSVCWLHIYLSAHADERTTVGQGTFTTGTQPHRLQLCAGARTERGLCGEHTRCRAGGALRAPRETAFLYVFMRAGPQVRGRSCRV